MIIIIIIIYFNTNKKTFVEIQRRAPRRPGYILRLITVSAPDKMLPS